MEKIVIVTRIFQPGNFSRIVFENKAREIKKIMKFRDDLIERIIVMVNNEKGNPLAEKEIKRGVSPTIAGIKEAFPREVKEKIIIPRSCYEWGANPGSATALNEGIRVAKEFNKKIEKIMIWSPEIEINGYQIHEAVNFMEQRNLQVCGFLREGWWEKPQWNVVQNTAAIWEMEFLQTMGYFAPECNNIGETIYQSEFGEIPIAGMEDFHLILRALKKEGEIRWGMYGRANPLKWDIDFSPGSQREKAHKMKVARQYAVMRYYSKLIFPHLTFKMVMGKLFSGYHQE